MKILVGLVSAVVGGLLAWGLRVKATEDKVDAFHEQLDTYRGFPLNWEGQ